MNYENLSNYINKIEDFENMTSSSQIDYFSYYLQVKLGHEAIYSKDIVKCFDILNLHPYSNISAYLSKNSDKKALKYIKLKKGYILHNAFKKNFHKNISDLITPEIEYLLFPEELFSNTRGYLIKVAEQATLCYEYQAFDACLVLIRKLVETLIIELFEKHNIEGEIKGNDGYFYSFSDLISRLLSNPKWNISRNTTLSLPRIKKFGDLSAHNRRFIAKQNDIDSIKDDIRIVFQELLLLIDY